MPWLILRPHGVCFCLTAPTLQCRYSHFTALPPTRPNLCGFSYRTCTQYVNGRKKKQTKKKNSKVVAHSRGDNPFYCVVQVARGLTHRAKFGQTNWIKLPLFHRLQSETQSPKERRYFWLCVMQPLLIVPYKQAKSSLRCARRGAQTV